MFPALFGLQNSGGNRITNRRVLYLDERVIVAGGQIVFNFEDFLEIGGKVVYLYIGHTKVDIDFVGLEPVIGFNIQSSLFGTMQETGENTPPAFFNTTSWIEIVGYSTFLRATRGDTLTIFNLDGLEYRCQIKLVIEYDEEIVRG